MTLAQFIGYQQFGSKSSIVDTVGSGRRFAGKRTATLRIISPTASRLPETYVLYVFFSKMEPVIASGPARTCVCDPTVVVAFPRGSASPTTRIPEGASKP